MATYDMYELNAKDQFRTEFIERFVIVHQGDPKKTILYFRFLSKYAEMLLFIVKESFSSLNSMNLDKIKIWYKRCPLSYHKYIANCSSKNKISRTTSMWVHMPKNYKQ